MQYFGYFFPVFFIGMWVLVIFVISRMGWVNLVENYYYEAEFTGTRVGIISASVNNTNYKNSLVLKYNEQGIYLRPVWLFRLFHKPVLIPWKEIKEVRDRKILFFTFKELIIGQPFVATLGLKKSVFARIESDLINYSPEKY